MKNEKYIVFRKNLKKIQRDTGLKDIDFARRIGISKPYLSQIYSGKRCGAQMIFTICERLGVPVSSMIEDDKIQKKIEPINKHAHIIARFKNKDLALRVNMDLVEMEAIDPEEFRDLCSEIKGRLAVIKKTSRTIGE